MKKLVGVCLAIFCLVVAIAAVAQDSAWPNQPIKFVVPFAPGSSGDIAARKVGPIVAQRVGASSIVIENRTGASGNVGLESVANAPADGYTFLIAADIQSSATPLMPAPYFDTNFVPVAPLVFVDMFVAATPSLPATNLAEMVAYAKAHPGKINYGSTGIGSAHQLIMEYLKMLGSFDVFHIPYRSTPVALPDLASGRIQVMFTALSTAMPLINERKLKALAVGALKRNPQLPDTPTLAESGFPGVEYYNYWSVWAKAGTPDFVVKRMREALLEAEDDPGVREWFATVGLSPFQGGLEGLMYRVKSDREKWASVIAATKIEPPR